MSVRILGDGAADRAQDLVALGGREAGAALLALGRAEVAERRAAARPTQDGRADPEQQLAAMEAWTPEVGGTGA